MRPNVRVKGRWMYLYRAVDSRGQTIDFLLSAKRTLRPHSASSAAVLTRLLTPLPRSG